MEESLSLTYITVLECEGSSSPLVGFSDFILPISERAKLLESVFSDRLESESTVRISNNQGVVVCIEILGEDIASQAISIMQLLLSKDAPVPNDITGDLRPVQLAEGVVRSYQESKMVKKVEQDSKTIPFDAQTKQSEFAIGQNSYFK